jgi:hypothetical protein
VCGCVSELDKNLYLIKARELYRDLMWTVFGAFETKKNRSEIGKFKGNSEEICSILIFTNNNISIVLSKLLRLTASSYDIIDGFELFPPIVHCFTLFTEFFITKSSWNDGDIFFFAGEWSCVKIIRGSRSCVIQQTSEGIVKLLVLFSQCF